LTKPASLRLIFAGTPDFAASHLLALLEDHRQVVAVYSQPDRPAGRGKKLTPSPVKQLALDHGLPVYQPASLRDSCAQADLAGLQPDLMVVVAYGLLLPQAVLDIPRFGCINVHASLLPRWRGAAPIQRAIAAGDARTGITIMQMDAGLDTGAMLLKVSCDIDPKETGGSLHDKLARLGPPALLRALDLIAAGELSPVDQAQNESTYAAKISKQDAAIDWRQSADTICRRIRAFNPFPVAFASLDGLAVRIWNAEPLPGSGFASDAIPGEIIATDRAGIDVTCGTGVLRIIELQLPGKKRLPAAELLRGHEQMLAVGNRFSL